MKVAIINYTNGDEAFVAKEVELDDEGQVRVIAPNGLTHIFNITNVHGIYNLANAHNITKEGGYKA